MFFLLFRIKWFNKVTIIPQRSANKLINIFLTPRQAVML
jgi:hypothetical protein